MRKHTMILAAIMCILVPSIVLGKQEDPLDKPLFPSNVLKDSQSSPLSSPERPSTPITPPPSTIGFPMRSGLDFPLDPEIRQRQLQRELNREIFERREEIQHFTAALTEHLKEKLSPDAAMILPRELKDSLSPQFLNEMNFSTSDDDLTLAGKFVLLGLRLNELPLTEVKITKEKRDSFLRAEKAHLRAICFMIAKGKWANVACKQDIELFQKVDLLASSSQVVWWSGLAYKPGPTQDHFYKESYKLTTETLATLLYSKEGHLPLQLALTLAHTLTPGQTPPYVTEEMKDAFLSIMDPSLHPFIEKVFAVRKEINNHFLAKEKS